MADTLREALEKIRDARRNSDAGRQEEWEWFADRLQAIAGSSLRSAPIGETGLKLGTYILDSREGISYY